MALFFLWLSVLLFASSKKEGTVCVPLVLYSSLNWDDSWRGAKYSIVDDEGLVVKTGTRKVDDNGEPRFLHDHLKFCGRVGCYSMVVTKPQNFLELAVVTWKLGDDLEGGPSSTTDFFLSEEGLVTKGCRSLAPTTSRAPTVSEMPTSFPTVSRPCFRLFLGNSRRPGEGWQYKYYSVLSNENVVIKNGTLERFLLNKTDDVCVPEAPACYSLSVEYVTSSGASTATTCIKATFTSRTREK